MMLARVVYSMALSIREREFVIAARYMGSGRGRSSPATSSRTCRRCWSSTSRSRWSARSSPRRGFRSWVGREDPRRVAGLVAAVRRRHDRRVAVAVLLPAAVLTLLTLSMTLMADGLRDALDPNAANPTVTEPVEVAGAEPGGGR